MPKEIDMKGGQCERRLDWKKAAFEESLVKEVNARIGPRVPEMVSPLIGGGRVSVATLDKRHSHLRDVFRR